MSTMFAAVLFRDEEISDRALAQGFGVALAGYDVPAPHVLVAPLRGVPGWSAAFYQSGTKLTPITRDDELDHACELFEDDLPPAVCVLDAAAEMGVTRATVYAITYSSDPIHDDAWRFSPSGVTRRYVHDGDEDLEAGVEMGDESEVRPLPLKLKKGATPEEEQAAIRAVTEEHRGSTFLAAELKAPVLGALMGALFAPDRRIDARMIEASADSIAEETSRLNRVLGRVDGRGAFDPPAAVQGIATPLVYKAFVRTYDWADPADPQDLYRELSIGAIEGTLRFLREEELRALENDPAWAAPSASSLYPIATLRRGSMLGGSRAEEAKVALAADRDLLVIIRPGGNYAPAGPTFGELLRYLSLGWKSRSEEEEDFIGALMLRAKLRSLRD